MAVLRCPVCRSDAETPGPRANRRYLCTKCGFYFQAREGNETGEYNLFGNEPPPFLPEPTPGLGPIAHDRAWWEWVSRLAQRTGVEGDDLLRRAMAEYAKRHGLGEPPPRKASRG